jgi:hypothetical protein
MAPIIISLPKELLRLVLEELWLATPDAGTNLLPLANHSLDLFAEAKHRPPPWGPTKEIPPPANGLPLWLLTSKMMMEEGVAAFNGIGRMYMSTPQLFFGCDEDDKEYDEAARRISWYNPETFPSLLSPDKWRRLFLFFEWPHHYFDPTQRRPLVDWDLRDVEYCRDLFAHIGKTEVLRELEFRFTASMYEVDSIYTVDLKPLAALVGGFATHLDRLDVFLEIERDCVVEEEEQGDEEVLALEEVRDEVEVLILQEVRKLSKGALVEMSCDVTEGIEGMRLWEGDFSKFRGWRLLWTR